VRKLVAEIMRVKLDEYGGRVSASIVLCRMFVMHKMKDERRTGHTREVHRDRRYIRVQQECPLRHLFALLDRLFLPLAASAFWCRSFRRCWARVLGHSPMC
jgi:hypothetical protein